MDGGVNPDFAEVLNNGLGGEIRFLSSGKYLRYKGLTAITVGCAARIWWVAPRTFRELTVVSIDIRHGSNKLRFA
jgi:hypothetical protein